MRKTQFILAAVLLPAALGGAQAARTTGSAPGAAKPTPPAAEKSRPVAHEAFEITIIFRRYQRDKLVTDRSYTLLATTGEVMPAMRDDEHYRQSLAGNDGANGAVDHNIDVDILSLRREGGSVFVALRISTENFDIGDPLGTAKLPVETTTHQYLVTPTIPIGKLVTVYAAKQPMRNQEVQLEVKPYRPDPASTAEP